jgi:hypothetical protein
MPWRSLAAADGTHAVEDPIARRSRILDDRHGRGSTIVTTQLPIEHWHEMIPIRLSPTPSWIGLCTTPIA